MADVNTNENTNNAEEISIEELRELLASKGLDIRELAREAKELKATKEMDALLEEKTTAPKPRNNNDPEYELALVNYPDFVIRRSTSKTEKLMVIMVSQNAYYIKTVKSGREEKETLTRKNYAAFPTGMPDFMLPEDFWVSKVLPGVAYYDSLMGVLRHEEVRKAIIEKYFRKKTNNNGCPVLRSDDLHAYEEIPNVLKAFPEKDFGASYQVIKLIVDKFGLENAKDFIRECDISLAETDFSYGHQSQMEDLFKNNDFKYDTFKQYILYDSVRMGYGLNLYYFLSEWKDTLSMQKDLYGKVKEKYPRHLQELHAQCSYKCTLRREEINALHFERQSKKTAAFEAEHDEFVFIAPKTPQDFYDEATAMSNCLASYVQRYADGYDHILFMRDKDEPDVSLVTIEIDLDGNLKQAYRAYNHRVTEKQNEAIKKWLARTVMPALNKAAA